MMLFRLSILLYYVIIKHKGNFHLIQPNPTWEKQLQLLEHTSASEACYRLKTIKIHCCIKLIRHESSSSILEYGVDLPQ